MDRREAIKSTALMLGVTASASTISMLFDACQSTNNISWNPVFLNKDQAQLVSDIAETILPESDTPGAKSLKVEVFVDLMLKETLSEQDQKHVLNGIDSFVSYCSDTYDQSFSDISLEEKKQVLTYFEQNSNKFNPSLWGGVIGEQPPIDFYRRIKQFTLLGYYTSEFIGKNVLSYDPVPGRQEGCIPVDTIGNAWTL